MGQIVGGQSDVGRLRRVLVKHARDAFGDAPSVERQWRDLRYLAPPAVPAAVAEYDRFLTLFEAASGTTVPWKAGMSAGSTSARWPWAGATGPTMPGSGSSPRWSGIASTKSWWYPCLTGAGPRTCST